MSFNDGVANMLTIIRNASRAGKEKADVPHSRLLAGVADILKREGYIDNFRVIKDKKQGVLRVYLRYARKKPVIKNLKRVSRPGLRIYASAKKIPRVLRGRGMAILSTSKGLMSDVQARDSKVGGEVLCYVW